MNIEHMEERTYRQTDKKYLYGTHCILDGNKDVERRTLHGMKEISVRMRKKGTLFLFITQNLMYEYFTPVPNMVAYGFSL